jgi:hypothetical protein
MGERPVPAHACDGQLRAGHSATNQELEMRREAIQKRTNPGAIPLAVASLMTTFAVCGVAHAAKPVPSLNAAVCASLSGLWASPTCTIPEGVNGVASADFRITKSNVLDVRGGLTVNKGVTIANAGAIAVANTMGVVPPEFDEAGLMAGILVLGAIDNAGVITIGNQADSTVGIAISVSVSVKESDPLDPNPLLVVPGALNNSGTVVIQNSGQSQGINNLGSLSNAATGAITVANSLTGSVGIRNRRDSSVGSQYYIVGTLTNAGRLTTGEGGDGASRGVSNSGSFINAVTGTFTIGASTVTDVLAYGFRNNGTFTNFGTFINNRGSYDNSVPENSTWGSYNLGTMVNYGKNYTGTAAQRTGSFYNEALLLNLGEITSYGDIIDVGAFMVNYATLYNYGRILGGVNLGICIDQPGSFGGC